MIFFYLKFVKIKYESLLKDILLEICLGLICVLLSLCGLCLPPMSGV